MIPTLKLFDADSDVVTEVQTYFKLGGQILFGTDVGYLSDFDPTREYELMGEAGLGWRETLAGHSPRILRPASANLADAARLRKEWTPTW